MVFRNDDENLQYELLPERQKNRLSTEQILSRLGNLRRWSNVKGVPYTYVSFYFNYDVTKWLEDWPAELRTELWEHGRVLWKNSRGVPYIIGYVPNKLFRIETVDYHGNNRYIVIYDVFPFFQTSFVKALINWGITDEATINKIDEMKQARSQFANYSQKAVIEYCGLECAYLCQLMNKVRDALADEDIPVKQWFGSGAVGQALLQRENMKQYIQPSNYLRIVDIPDVDNAIMSAYFGGRFEIMRQGIVGETHQYDINSAYPYAMTTIPDMSNAYLEFVEKYDDEEKFALWFVSYDTRTTKGTPLFGPLPFRTQTGNVVFPHANTYGCWVHACELAQAIVCYGRPKFNIIYGFVWRGYNTRKNPFAFVHKISQRRLALKAKGDKRNIVLKLALNSLYGKMAQGLGSGNKLPPFQNYYLAGYVTAFCRAELLRIGWSCGYHGSDVTMFATDGIFSISPSTILGTNSSDKLGQWEYTRTTEPICYLQAGIYFKQKKAGEKEKDAKRRTRGFRALRLSAATIFDAWTNGGPGTKIDAKDSRFVGIGSCIITKRWNEYGSWKTVPHEISISPPSGKQYLFESGYTIDGLSDKMGEVQRGTDDYLILVAWNESPKLQDVSRAYPHKHQRDIAIRLGNIEPQILDAIRQEIMDFDQPDYERWRGFGDMEPRDNA